MYSCLAGFIEPGETLEDAARRETLEDVLWGDDFPDSDSLRSHIHQLRQVVDRPFASNLLHTVHGIGYRLGEPTDNG